MGSITYDNVVVSFEDRALAHLQVVIVQRFMQGSSVLLSWLDPLHVGDGRSSMWLTPHAALHFKFAGSRTPQIDRDWLRSLSERAASGTGLVVCSQDGTLMRADDLRTLRAS